MRVNPGGSIERRVQSSVSINIKKVTKAIRLLEVGLMYFDAY